MGKVVMTAVLIVLGLFAVLVMNNNSRPKPALENASLSLSLTATPSSKTSPTSQTNEVSNAVTAVIKTDRGDIEITLYPKDSPKTVQNFVQKAKSGFYNNLIFHRVEDWVVQGGDPLGNGTGGGNMQVEFNNKPFVVGAVGVASRGDGQVQNDAQFFIVKKDSQFLNGKYTNFGIVTKGMDAVNKMAIGDKILGITIQ